jgi:predicted DNA-binding transcriptional regulator YafY
MESYNLGMTRERLLALYEILKSMAQGRKKFKLSDLSNELFKMEIDEVDRRTLYKDLYLLNRITGIKCAYDEKTKAYKVLLNDSLSESELKTILHSIYDFRFSGGEKEKKKLAEKICRLAGYSKIPNVIRSIGDEAGLTGESDTYEKLDFIQDAINKNRRIIFDYQKPSAKKKYETVRTCDVNPYKLIGRDKNMYLIGSYDKTKFFSHYRTERIINLRLSDEKRDSIGEIIGHGNIFDEAEYLQKKVAFSKGEMDYVEIRFSNENLENSGEVFDRFGINGVRIIENADGSFVLRDTVQINKKFIRWILGFGDSAEVIFPPELRGEVAEILKKAGKIY